MPRSSFYLIPPILVCIVWWLTTWEHVWFLVMGIIFVFSMFLYTRARDNEQRQQEAAETKRLLGRVRHDLMNHVQVLMGYQMMKREDKMNEYLERLATQATKEREIAELPDEELAVFLLMLSFHYPQWEWEVQILPTYIVPIAKTNEPISQWLAVCIEVLAKMGEEKYDWQKVVLQLSGDDQTNFFSFQVYNADGEVIHLHVPEGEWTNLKDQFNQLRMEIVGQQRLTLRTGISR